MISATLYVCTDEPERVVKTALSHAYAVQLNLLREECIEDIAITLEFTAGDTLDQNKEEFNYLYVPDLGRYYYKTKSYVMNNKMVRYTFHVDVLMTYAAQIKQETAIISRQQNEGNMYLTDPSIPAENRDDIFFKEFPSGFDLGLSYYMTVGG